MKQKINTMKPPTEPITDLDIAFVAIYNLIYEKMEQEPNKGIVVSKGNPNQRKAKWSEVMEITHALEDFFILRKHRTGNKTCSECRYWESISKASTHIGRCNKYNRSYLHEFSSCKNGFEPRGDI